MYTILKENVECIFIPSRQKEQLLSKWLKNKKPTRRYLLFYWTSYRLNMFRALLWPSSEARDYDVNYHIGRFVLGLLYVGGEVRVGWSSVRVAG